MFLEKYFFDCVVENIFDFYDLGSNKNFHTNMFFLQKIFYTKIFLNKIFFNKIFSCKKIFLLFFPTTFFIQKIFQQNL